VKTSELSFQELLKALHFDFLHSYLYYATGLFTDYCLLFTEKSPLPEKNQKRKVSKRTFPCHLPLEYQFLVVMPESF
jgi:hypothetical protein